MLHQRAQGVHQDPLGLVVGNVSARVPAIHPFVAIMGEDGADHTPRFAEAAASPRARDVLLAVTRALACTAADVLLSEELRTRAWAGHRTA